MILVGAAREYFTVAGVFVPIFGICISVFETGGFWDFIFNLVSLNSSSKHCISSQLPE